MDKTIRNLDREVYREIKARAALEGKTVGHLVNEAMRAYLRSADEADVPVPREGRTVEESVRRWAKQAGCRLCVLFGSRAHGGPGVFGDVDVAVEFAGMPGPAERLRFIGELQDAVGSAPVDIVFLHAGTDPALRFEIFRTGEPIHEQRPGLFVEGRVKALTLFEDSLPFRRALRESLRRFTGSEPDDR